VAINLAMLSGLGTLYSYVFQVRRQYGGWARGLT
jgi:hypothetical protein